MSVEPADLTAFKDRLWHAVLAAKRRYNWCGTEMNILRTTLGITGPAVQQPEVPEPSEDGIYRISTATYFFIRYTNNGTTYWVITALRQPKRHTSEEAGTWADVVTFMREQGLMPNRHRQLVKI